jgi:8-oxo-dGTP diphosphatase
MSRAPSSTDGRRYPARPIVGVGALVIDAGSILLVERGREPLKGWWSLPGGVVEAGEPLEAAVRREVLEETGLEVEVIEFVTVFERILRDAEGRVEYHYVLADYLCRATGGSLFARDDASRAEWVPRAGLAALKLTEGTLAVIEKAFSMRT